MSPSAVSAARRCVRGRGRGDGRTESSVDTNATSSWPPALTGMPAVCAIQSTTSGRSSAEPSMLIVQPIGNTYLRVRLFLSETTQSAGGDGARRTR